MTKMEYYIANINPNTMINVKTYLIVSHYPNGTRLAESLDTSLNLLTQD